MRKPGPGEAQMYEGMGTTTDVKTCDFCKARGLAETVVLIVHNVDGELAGYMHACDPCAAKAALRDAQKPQRHKRARQDPRLRRRLGHRDLDAARLSLSGRVRVPVAPVQGDQLAVQAVNQEPILGELG